LVGLPVETLVAQAAVGTFDDGNLGVEHEFDAALFEVGRDLIAQVEVEAAQGLVSVMDQGDVRSESLKDARELETDIAGADDGDALWELFQMKGFVGRDAVLGPGNLRDSRAPPGCQ